MMVLFPNKSFTLIFSASNNAIALINNASQKLSQDSAGNTAILTLPGFTESVVVAPDNVTGFAAVPTATVTPGTGQPPGLVEVMDLKNNLITAGIPVTGAHYLAQSHNGNRLLALGSRADTVTMIAPSRRSEPAPIRERIFRVRCLTIPCGRSSATTIPPPTF